MKININDVIMIEGDEKNCGKWKAGVIENISKGKDKTITSIRIRTRKSFIERPIQLPYSMELYCGSKSITSNTQKN